MLTHLKTIVAEWYEYVCIFNITKKNSLVLLVYESNTYSQSEKCTYTTVYRLFFRGDFY